MTSKITSFGTGCLDLEKVYYYSETELQKKKLIYWHYIEEKRVFW